MISKLLFLASTVAILLNTVHAKQCTATAYYHKKVAYNSGIYFQHGDVHHASSYGSFWSSVNETSTKNIGLKRMTLGYDKDMVGYIWGNAIEYGYVGSGRGYVLGLQAAVGSLTGLTTLDVERAFMASQQGKSEGTWNHTSGFPNLASPAGASTLTGWATVMNRTAIEAALGNVTAANDDDNPTGVTAQQRRADTTWSEDNDLTLEKRGDSSDDDDVDDDDDDDDCGGQDDDEEDSSAEAEQKQKHVDATSKTKQTGKDDNNSLTWKHPPQECAVYHAPWKTSKPVYFHGQCDKCNKKTGFNERGHGSFQSCTLIYHGKEYKGKPGQTNDLYTCVVDFACA